MIKVDLSNGLVKYGLITQTVSKCVQILKVLLTNITWSLGVRTIMETV